jgi:hypothetical protein
MGPLQQFATSGGVSRTANFQAAHSGQSHSSNSSRLRNFITANHLNPLAHNSACTNGNISL